MSEHFIVDTSVVSKLYLRDEQWTANADALFARFERGETELLAPRLVMYEVPASIRKAIAQRRILESDGQDAIRRFRRLPLPIIDDKDALEEAFRLANRYSCSYYDAIFLTLAEDLGWNFVTAEVKLCRRLQPQLRYIIRLDNLI